MADENSELTPKDTGVIAVQGALMAIPYVGSTLAHYIFGPLTERRLKRIEQTLSEVAEQLGAGHSDILATENFANLLESIAAELGRCSTEDKRQRFRDLLINAGRLDSESPKWAETQLAAGLISEIEPPGLELMSAISRCDRDKEITLTIRPVPQVVEGKFDYENPGDPQYPLSYDWVVVEYWARWLREQRLITYSSHDARGGFGGVGIMALGQFLIDWALIK